MDDLQVTERVAGTALKRFGLVGRTVLVTGGTKVSLTRVNSRILSLLALP